MRWYLSVDDCGPDSGYGLLWARALLAGKKGANGQVKQDRCRIGSWDKPVWYYEPHPK